MDFFNHQQQARVNTRKLVVYLLMAITSLLAITHAIFYLVFSMNLHSGRHDRYASKVTLIHGDYFNSKLFWFINIAILLIIAFATFYKWLTLRAGGAVIAEHLGAVLIPNSTKDFHEKRLLNVVQEMAIASGSPVPPVYVLEEDSINAFAAGHTPADAVITVTRGAIRYLNRDQLQGVIGHEFSHIFNGDARLNLNLIAILHGILVIGLLGYYAIRGARNASGRSAAFILGIGFGLVVLGYGGVFFGNLIKSAIARQREFLADASAVQFTRNPNGLADALKIVGGDVGSHLENAHVDEVTHLLFAEGKYFASNWWSTHPALETRIRRIEPRWDGRFISRPSVTETDDISEPTVTTTAKPKAAVAAIAALASIEHIGTIDQEHLGYTHEMLQQMPVELINGSRTPNGATEILLALVLSQTSATERLPPASRQDIQQRQATHAQLITALTALPDRMRLPLIDLCVASLKQTTRDYADNFKQQLDEYINLDKKVSLFEWCLRRIVHHQTNAFFRGPVKPVKYLRISECSHELGIVLSLLTQFDSQQNPAQIVQATANKFNLQDISYTASKDIAAEQFQRAVDHLQNLRPLDKPIAIKACANVITHDGIVQINEIEILRALSASWDCPIPPILVS